MVTVSIDGTQVDTALVGETTKTLVFEVQAGTILKVEENGIFVLYSLSLEPELPMQCLPGYVGNPGGLRCVEGSWSFLASSCAADACDDARRMG